MRKHLTATINEHLMDELQRLIRKQRIDNKSELVDYLLSLGMKEYKRVNKIK